MPQVTEAHNRSIGSPAPPERGGDRRPSRWTPRRATLVAVASVVLVAGVLWLVLHRRTASPAVAGPVPSGDTMPASEAVPDLPPSDDQRSTTLYAHNLRLRKGSTFRIYVRWIRGEMRRTRADVDPSLDDPDSFVLEIQKGVIRANIGDISNVLNSSMAGNSPLKHISIRPAGKELQLRGTLHRIVPLPVELVGTLSPTPDGRIRFHVRKIDVLKIPVKGLLGTFHLQLSDLMSHTGMKGVTVGSDDIFFDTQTLLPPPHIHGEITSVTVAPPDLQLIYGNAPNDANELAQWHNFFRLRGGTLAFGRLTMHPVDLTMIDAVEEPWFDLDLVNYQAQLATGYTRITRQTGLEVYIPQAGAPLKPKPAQEAVTLDWLKNKKSSLPNDVPRK